jgi:phosphoserine aminotransferase
MRSFNFSAGPAMLPEAVMIRAHQEFLDWNQTTMSVMEMSHRSPEFLSVAQKMEQDLKELMDIPDNYKILFTHGGASLQFSAIPLNLTQASDTVDYFNTGVWSTKAIAEAKRFCNVNIVSGEGAQHPTEIEDSAFWKFSSDAKYIHICMNETITGLEFQQEQMDVLFAQNKPIIADFSSTVLSRRIDVSKFGVIYAGAQKNIGPAGLAILIVREDLLGAARTDCPKLMNWDTYAQNESMFNTPNTWAWYLAGLVFEWLKDQGGVDHVAAVNEAKANKLYHFIDESGYYTNSIKPQQRSWMNVTFALPNESLNSEFLAQSKEAGLLNLKGHKAFGGMRASIYNAMPSEGIDALIAFMKTFAEKNPV